MTSIVPSAGIPAEAVIPHEDSIDKLLLQKAAEKGSVEAMAELINRFPFDEDYLHAWLSNSENYGKNLLNKIEKHYQTITRLLEAAYNGNGNCGYILGSLYSPVHAVKSLYWHLVAARIGHPISQWRVGIAYKDGKIEEPDNKKAVRWLLKAANQGHADAQNSLGRLYFEGGNLKKAHRWLSEAAEQENPHAQYNLGKLCSKKNDKENAFKWLVKAAEQGIAQAQYRVGMCYIRAKGVSYDKEECLAWLSRAASQGHKMAAWKLSLLTS